MNYAYRQVAFGLLLALVLAGCEKPKPQAAKPQAAAGVTPFNGKDFAGWKFAGRLQRNFWKVGAAEVDPANKMTMKVAPGGTEMISAGINGANIHTEREFKDFSLELEFMVPPTGNSGIFLMGQYEFQLAHDPEADPKAPSDMDIGGICRLVAPKQLVAVEPGKWYKVEIEFQAPWFDGTGKKTQNAKLVRAAIDGKVVHENAEIPGPTPGALQEEKEIAQGPLLLQGSEGPVAFRNITVKPAE